MYITTLQVGQLNTNCYIVSKSRWDSNCIIIDAGDDADFISRSIEDSHLTPKMIVATHGHSDHILAAGELQLIYNIPFLIHDLDIKFIHKFKINITIDHSSKNIPPIKVTQIHDDRIFIDDEKLEIMSLPGHTPGGIGLYNPIDKICFSGDILFADGFIGRTDFPYSNQEKLDLSINKLYHLPDATIIYPGHGQRFIINQKYV